MTRSLGTKKGGVYGHRGEFPRHRVVSALDAAGGTVVESALVDELLPLDLARACEAPRGVVGACVPGTDPRGRWVRGRAAQA